MAVSRGPSLIRGKVMIHNLSTDRLNSHAVRKIKQRLMRATSVSDAIFQAERMQEEREHQVLDLDLTQARWEESPLSYEDCEIPGCPCKR